MKSKSLLPILGILLVFLGIPCFLTWNFMIAPMLEWRQAFASIIGKSEPEVVAAIGAPKHKLSAEEAKKNGVDAPWRDMRYVPVPERPIHGPVWLYEEKSQAGWRGMYVFFGTNGKVEAVDAAAR